MGYGQKYLDGAAGLVAVLRQRYVIGAFARATEAFEKGVEKVAVFRIEQR